jgi:ligand-binding sensor domain-containing protein
VLSNPLSYMQSQYGLLLKSLTIQPDGTLLAASVNGGIFRILRDGAWRRTDIGIPEGTDVYRLETDGACIYACTSRGLYRLSEDHWEPTPVTVPCSRLRGRGGLLMAATDNGLWMKLPEGWGRTDYSEKPVYDLFQNPQMIFMAQAHGLTVYDRYTQTTDEFHLGAGISSLAVLQGSLLGATSTGDLMVGDKKGRFDLFRFGGIKLFSVTEAAGRIYACTNRGLYRILTWKGRYHLCSVKLGFPVTDMVHDKERLYLSTYFEGIRTVELQRGSGA